jgi:prepilin-type N-terminal cleavage/methylation domain-containing protein
MKKWAARQVGFTIVELLVVIVVIALLAAITIVAYNGIQQRARNAARIAAAEQIVKLFNANTIATGSIVPGAPVCIPVGTQDYNSDGTPDCGNITTPADVIRSEKTATNTFLTNAGMTNLNFPTDVVTTTTGTKYTGLEMTYSSSLYGMGGVLQPYFLYFKLEGSNQDCVSSYSIDITSDLDPLQKLVPARNYSYSNGVTFCAFTLKHSASL